MKNKAKVFSQNLKGSSSTCSYPFEEKLVLMIYDRLTVMSLKLFTFSLDLNAWQKVAPTQEVVQMDLACVAFVSHCKFLKKISTDRLNLALNPSHGLSSPKISLKKLLKTFNFCTNLNKNAIFMTFTRDRSLLYLKGMYHCTVNLL